MSKKRFFGAVTAAAVALGSICCPGTAAYAEENVEEKQAGVEVSVTDPENDVIRLEVTNNGLDGEQVGIYIFNPGSGVSDLKADGSTAASEALYQVLITDFSGQTNAYDIKMKEPAGEDHVYRYLVISQSGESMSGSFEYYTNSEKEELLSEINAAKEAEEPPESLAERIYSYFGFSDFTLYNSVTDKDKISSLFFQTSKTEEVTAENIEEIFEEAVVVAAFCGDGKALLENDKLLYMDFINPDEIYLRYYNEELSAKGTRESVLNICGEDYNSAEEIKEALENQIVINAINNNKLLGYGHVEQVISDFESDFTNAGLKLSDYNSSDKDKVASRFMQRADQDTLEEICDLLNEIISDLKGQGSNTGGGGGGGGGTGGVSRPSSGNSSKGQNTSDSASIAGPTASNPDTKDNVPSAVVFSDLEGYEWAKESIETLYREGIISGRGEGKFAPADPITREEFTVILVNAFDIADGNTAAGFDDVGTSRWSYAYIAKAASAGIISGDGRNFMPGNNITRQDIAAILVRTLMNKGAIADVTPAVGVFDDEDEISEYARESVQIMSELGVISGDGTGNFNPKDNATRAEAAVIVQRALELL